MQKLKIPLLFLLLWLNAAVLAACQDWPTILASTAGCVLLALSLYQQLKPYLKD